MANTTQIKDEPSSKKRRVSQQQSRMVVSSQFYSEAFKQLEEFRQKGFLCDFEIKVSGAVFKVHKNVLAARSGYFRLLFIVNAKHQVIVLNDVTKEAIEQCIQLMYTGKILVSIDSAMHILPAAKLFKLQEVFELYRDYLTEKLSAENCFRIKTISEKYDMKITEKAEKVITDNFHLVIDQNDFVHISRRDLLKYVNASKKNHVVWKAITVWGSHDFPARKDAFADILASLDLSRFTFEELNNMLGNKLVTDSLKTIVIVGNEIFRRFASKKISFSFGNWNFLRSLFRNYGLGDMERKVNGYVTENFTTMSRTQEFYKIKKDDLLFFLKAIRITPASERMLWTALVNWARFDEMRVKYFSEMVKLIDLKNFTLNFIKMEVKNEPLVAADNDCLRLVIDALCSK